MCAGVVHAPDDGVDTERSDRVVAGVRLDVVPQSAYEGFQTHGLFVQRLEALRLIPATVDEVSSVGYQARVDDADMSVDRLYSSVFAGCQEL